MENSLNLSDRRFGYILAAPSVLIIILIILFPISFAIVSSFFDYTLINKSFNNFIGIENYLNAIKNERLLYQLREYDSFDFVKSIKNLERKMFDLTNDFDKEMFILDKISELIGIESIKTEYKSNKIDENVETILVNFKELYEIIIHVYNNLNKDQYLLTRKCLKIVYEKVKGIIIKYNGF